MNGEEGGKKIKVLRGIKMNLGFNAQEISLPLTMQEIQFEKQINMLIRFSLIQIIIVCQNNYNSWSYIDSYK